MTKWIFSLLAISLLSACSDDTKQAKEAVTQVLSFRMDVGFREIASYPGDIVCGEFEEQNTMGGTFGFKPFIVREGVAETNPTKKDLLVYCSEDPAASLLDKLGIGPITPELMRVSNDLKTVSDAISHYLADTHMLPTNRQGLESLITQTTTPPVPRNFRQGGYLTDIPQDPWGRPYRYDNSSFGGSVGSYELYTLGADNAPGGSGVNADIDVEKLPYIQHVLSLQQ